jgi:hypothetical protein
MRYVPPVSLAKLSPLPAPRLLVPMAAFEEAGHAGNDVVLVDEAAAVISAFQAAGAAARRELVSKG